MAGTGPSGILAAFLMITSSPDALKDINDSQLERILASLPVLLFAAITFVNGSKAMNAIAEILAAQVHKDFEVMLALLLRGLANTGCETGEEAGVKLWAGYRTLFVTRTMSILPCIDINSTR